METDYDKDISTRGRRGVRSRIARGIASALLIMTMSASMLAIDAAISSEPANASNCLGDFVSSTKGARWETDDLLSNFNVAAFVVSWDHLGSTFQDEVRIYTSTCDNRILIRQTIRHSWSRYKACVGLGYGPVFKSVKCYHGEDYGGIESVTDTPIRR